MTNDIWEAILAWLGDDPDAAKLIAVTAYLFLSEE